jgi:AcrR family transcriptional regulator
MRREALQPGEKAIAYLAFCRYTGGMAGDMSVTAGRSNSRRSADARARVLAAAMRALAANGYQGSSLSSIAADAGLTTPGLLHHFRSKNHLLVALLEERDRLEAERAGLADARGLAALDRLLELAERNKREPEVVRAFTVLIGESASAEHPARRWAQQRYPRFQSRIATALRRGVEDGEIRTDVDLDAVAAQIIAMMDGLQVQWVLNPSRIDMTYVLGHYFAGLRRLLGA